MGRLWDSQNSWGRESVPIPVPNPGTKSHGIPVPLPIHDSHSNLDREIPPEDEENFEKKIVRKNSQNLDLKNNLVLF